MKKCNDCEELYSLIAQGKASHMPNKCFPVGGRPCSYLKTSQEYMNGLLTKAAQPLPKPEQPPAQEAKQTSGQPTSDDCSGSHTR